MDAPSLIERFFGTGNSIPSDLSGELRSDLDAMVDRLRQPGTSATFLPRLHEGCTYWYGFARDVRGRRELVELIAAAIGPTYSDIGRTHGELNEADPFDNDIKAIAEGLAMKFAVLPMRGPQAPLARTTVRNALRRTYKLLDRRPPAVLDLQRPVAQTLADLDHSIAACDEALARRLLDELDRFHTLTETNIVFLRIKVLAAFDRYQEILAHPALTHLIEMRRPRGVTLAILTAVYEVHLRALFESASIEELHSAFVRLRPLYGGAWEGAPDPNSIGSAVVLALAAVRTLDGFEVATGRRISVLDLEPERQQRLKQWVEHSAPDQLQRFEALFPSRGLVLHAAIPEWESTKEDQLARATRLFLAGDPVQALSLLAQVEPTPASARLAAVAADQVGTIAAAAAANLILSRLSDSERSGVLDGAPYAAVVHRLAELVGNEQTPPPKGWLEWARRLLTDPTWLLAPELARLGIEEWEPVPTDQLLRILNSLSDAAAPVIRASAGILLRAHPVVAVDQNSVNLASYLVLILSVAGQLSEAERTSFGMLVDAILESSPPSSLYGELLEGIREAASANASPYVADWLVDLLQMLADMPCPTNSTDERIALASFMMALLLRFANSIDSVQRAALMEVALGLDLPLAEALSPARLSQDDDRASRYIWLSNKTVGIYSLMIGSARRAASVLKRLVPSVSITLNDDHVATRQLTDLAMNADVMVVIPGSAKHSATDAIKASRRRGPTIECASRGASGILRCLEAMPGQVGN